MDFTRNNTMRDFLKKIISTEIQMRIKREGSKIYPVRFSEVARIKVLRSPEFRTKPEKPKEVKEKEQEEKPGKEEKPKKEEKSEGGAKKKSGKPAKTVKVAEKKKETGTGQS